MKLKSVLFLLTAALFSITPQGLAEESSSASAILEEIPVQHAGRIKPFQSFAEETVLYVTGKAKFSGMEPARLIWEWIALAEKWYTKPLIPVTREALREDFGVMLVKGRLSPEVALNHEPFLSKVRDAAGKQQRKDPLSQDEKQTLEIYDKASHFRSIGQGEVPGWIAHPNEPRASWLPIESLISEQGRSVAKQFYPPEQVDALGANLAALLEEFRKTEGGEISPQAALAFSQSLKAIHRAGGVALDEALIQKEIRYNRLEPFSKAMYFYFGSLALFIIGLLTSFSARFRAVAKIFSGLSLLAFIAAFLIHGWGFYLRCAIAGRPPVTNMYESMIWVSWTAALFALILYAVYRNWFILNSAGLVAALCLAIAQKFPVALNPAISPLVPVLRSNLWLTVHVLTITMSYGAFALAWGMGHGVLFNYAVWPERRETLRSLSQYLYRTLQIGVVLLAAGTILGGVWANYSWGRFWGWDPKETWALIALLGYLVVLHGRFAGWLADFGIAAGSVLAFLGVVMAWYGVNFVLAAGLHSYGFGGGGLQYVLAAVIIDLLIVGYLAFRYKYKQSLARTRREA